jgi:hypothetical protein
LKKQEKNGGEKEEEEEEGKRKKNAIASYISVHSLADFKAQIKLLRATYP